MALQGHVRARRDSPPLPVALQLPGEALEDLARQVADLLAGQLSAAAGPEDWLDVTAAAHYLGYGHDDAGNRRGKQRIYDLVSQRRLRFAKDGSRLLFRRSWLDDYLEGRQTGMEI